jgi:phosphate transport system substrate-binding protein
VSAALSWPVGISGNGNEGVAGLVRQTANSIGYVELVYATQNKMTYGQVQNAAGKYIKADLNSVTAAAAGDVPSMPADFRVSITNAPDADAYPVSSFIWMLVPQDFKDAGKGAFHFVILPRKMPARALGVKFRSDLTPGTQP